MSKVYRIKAVQKIPVDMAAAWAFFCSPHNLAAITPPEISFKVTNAAAGEEGGNMYAGQIIEYRLNPLLGISFYWMTEITHINEPHYFIDEQRFGPYSLWHHQHHFKQIEGGIEMTDIVHYKIPYWFIGSIANTLLVRKQLLKIFSFRYHAITERFGAWANQQPNIEIS